jgi:putative membrane protein
VSICPQDPAAAADGDQRRPGTTCGKAAGYGYAVEQLGQLLLSWAVNALVLAGVAWILNGVSFDDRTALIVAAAVFGILNTILKPAAKLLTLPLAIVTLGIAWLFVAMLMLWITQALVSGFHIDGFWTYVWATIIVWALNLVLDALVDPWRNRGRRAAY